MDQNKFVALVKEMRGAQKDYFRNRWDSGRLQYAKKLEKRVDDAISEYETRNEPKQAALL